MPNKRNKQTFGSRYEELNKHLIELKQTTHSLISHGVGSLLTLNHSANTVRDEINFIRSQLEGKIKSLTIDALKSLDDVIDKETLMLQNRKEHLNDVLTRLNMAENSISEEFKCNSLQAMKKLIQTMQNGKEHKRVTFTLNDVAEDVLHVMFVLGKTKLQNIAKSREQPAEIEQRLCVEDRVMATPRLRTAETGQTHVLNLLNASVENPPLNPQLQLPVVSKVGVIQNVCLRNAVENTDSDCSGSDKSKSATTGGSLIELDKHDITRPNYQENLDSLTCDFKYLVNRFHHEQVSLFYEFKSFPRFANSSMNITNACSLTQSVDQINQSNPGSKYRHCGQIPKQFVFKSASHEILNTCQILTDGNNTTMSNADASVRTSRSSGYCQVCLPNTHINTISMHHCGYENSACYNSKQSLDEHSCSSRSTNRSESLSVFSDKKSLTMPAASKPLHSKLPTSFKNTETTQSVDHGEVNVIYKTKLVARTHRSSCVVPDITVMPDYRIVLSDHYHNNIQLYAKDLTFIVEKQCPYPMGICTVDANTIAVSLRRNGQISFYRVTEKNLQHFRMINVNCEYYIWNVTFKAERLYVTCDENNIHVIDCCGTENYVIRSGIPTEHGYVRYFDVSDAGDRLYLCEEKGLRCIDFLGKLHWRFTLENVPDAEKDKHEHVLEDVCFCKDRLLATHWTQNKIFEISTDGLYVRNIVTSNLEHPRAMAVMEDMLAVTQFNPHHKTLNTGSTPPTEIKVFELLNN